VSRVDRIPVMAYFFCLVASLVVLGPGVGVTFLHDVRASLAWKYDLIHGWRHSWHLFAHLRYPASFQTNCCAVLRIMSYTRNGLLIFAVPLTPA
jgi:hypothetical protein